MKQSKSTITQRILALGVKRPCLKLELQNIVFPKWDDLGLIGMMFRQCVNTKEQPEGHIYDEATFQTVLRIIGGKVLMNNQPDCYCWKFNKVASATNISQIGTNSAEALMNLCKILDTVSDQNEKRMLAETFANLKRDLLLVTTPAEERTCIEVTPELYEKHKITFCIDEWMATDENGDAEVTKLEIGDFMIATPSGGIYRIGKEEFLATHKLM